MNNIFTITESEKNRIRGLHETYKRTKGGLITESDWKMADNGKQFGTDNRGSMTQEWFDGLHDAAKAEVAGLGLKNNTINLYKPDDSGNETTEVIGKYQIEEVTLNEEAGAGIKIKFNLEGDNKYQQTEGFIMVDWHCGDTKDSNGGEQMRVIDTGSDKLGLTHVTNNKFEDVLKKKLCRYDVSMVRTWEDFKTALDEKKWVIVDDADFASNDQTGGEGDEGGIV